MQRPTKAIIAAAGFGTRFLPQTKAMPKEMMPIIDKPIIQYVVEELLRLVSKILLSLEVAIKRAIEDHFDLGFERRSTKQLQACWRREENPSGTGRRYRANMANFIYLRQKGPYGNATPVQCAAHLIGNEPFILYFCR